MAPSSASRPAAVLVAGAGPAGLEALLALADLAEERVALTLLARDADLDLRALRLAAAEGADQARPHPVDVFAAAAGARLVRGTLARVVPDERRAVLRDGRELPYDELVVATGAAARPWLPGALTVGLGATEDGLRDLLREAERSPGLTLAVVVPPGCSWPLPLYELALVAAARLGPAGAARRVLLVTRERQPLDLFGAEASAAVRRLLDDAGVTVHGGREAVAAEGGAVRLADGGALPADRTVTLPRLEARRTPGLPAGPGGWLPVDDHGRVAGVDRVFAAGDGADHPIKQGGLACQQADAVARTIAADAGAPVVPEPWAPVLRGKLLTGRGAAYLRAALDDPGSGRWSDTELWWPPAKVSGRYLARFLATLEGPDAERAQPRAPRPAPAR